MTGRPVAEVYKEFSFEAAHWLPSVPEDHKDRQVHGHSYRVCIRVRGPVDDVSGYVCDFAAIKAVFSQLNAQLDHRCLNELTGLANPTSEVLAIWIWDRLHPGLPGLLSVEVRENATSGCIYGGERT